MSEAELCAKFTRWVTAHSDWIVYAETGGFDMLLVAPDGRRSASRPSWAARPK